MGKRNKNEESLNSLSLLNDIFDGVYIVDKDRKILFWNKGAEDVTGYKSAEVAGKHCSDNILNHIDEKGNLICKTDCPLKKTLETGKKIKTKVYPLHKSKKRFPVMTHIAPIKDKEGNIVAAIEVFRDITKEEEFRILQEKFNRLIKKYVSSATYDDVLNEARSNAASTAHKKDLSVLYLDIVGFTGYSEKHSPENVTQMLNEVFGICEIITKECFGDIDKFIGDAVMAIFIDANDAANAAVKILRALSKMNKNRTEKNQEKINVRIGINSGEVIQGTVGTVNRRDLTVIGDVVNTASRIQNISPVNTVAVSESTYSRIKQPEDFKFYKEVKVKGKANPVPIYLRK